MKSAAAASLSEAAEGADRLPPTHGDGARRLECFGARVARVRSRAPTELRRLSQADEFGLPLFDKDN